MLRQFMLRPFLSAKQIAPLLFSAALLASPVATAQDSPDSAAAVAWDAAPLRDTFVDVYKLKDWGTQKYARYVFPTHRRAKRGVLISEREADLTGIYSFKTEVTFDSLVFRDVWRDPVKTRGAAVVRLECERNSLMGVRKMSIQYNGWKHYDFTGGEYRAELLGEPRSGPWPKETLTDAALMRLVTILPRAPGKSYEFEAFSITPDVNPQPAGGAIRCWGPRSITIRGAVHSATYFQAADYHLWVRDDGILLRAEVPGWHILEWVDPASDSSLDRRIPSPSPLVAEWRGTDSE